MEDFLDLLSCPACRGALDGNLICENCAQVYAATDGIIHLRLPGDARTNIVRQFYGVAPFPGYPPRDSLDSLRARAERSPFARLLDQAITSDASIVEIGCGTGQMSLYLARAQRRVIAADLTIASLKLGAAAAGRFELDRVRFIETDLQHPGLHPGAFDVVYCSGVLHHTPDPRCSFARIVELAKPGGMIVIGLYNAFARIPLRLRRIAARFSGYRWIPFDPVLRDRASEPARREAWLRDQYRHPEEHRHTIAEVRGWFAQNNVDYIRSYPSAMIGENPENLFSPESDDWGFEAWLAQIGWMHSLGHEGGLFVGIGRRVS